VEDQRAQDGVTPGAAPPPRSPVAYRRLIAIWIELSCWPVGSVTLDGG
jgi:hypothetical protein